jgi:amidase
VEDAHPPVDFSAQVELFNRMILAAVSPSMGEIGDGLSGTHYAWLAAERERARLRAVWNEWFETYDLLLCPVLPTPAFPHNQEGEMFTRTLTVNGAEVPYLNCVVWTGLIGVVGLPSAVPPVGRTPAGLPIGVQVVAPYLRDRDAVQAAALVAEVSGGYAPPPGFG